MHSKKILRLRLNFTVMLLSAFVSCIGMTAQATENPLGKSATQWSFKMDLHSKGMLASTSSNDNDDCEEYAEEKMPSIQMAKLELDKKSNGSRSENSNSPDIKPLKIVKSEPDAVKVEAPVPAPVWEIALTDKTLNGALARWSVAAGWQLMWELSVDYAVEARTTIPGTFEEAVEMVTKSMGTAEIPMKAIFYKGNKVLRIVQKGVK
ncbi:MAG: toxin co-regulated pilus biosynthesis Q family protein [Burkholderiaceae bacterium]